MNREMEDEHVYSCSLKKYNVNKKNQPMTHYSGPIMIAHGLCRIFVFSTNARHSRSREH
jgi:hypothetical protein